MAESAKRRLRIILGVAFVLVLLAGAFAFRAYSFLIRPNTEVGGERPAHLYILSDWTLDSVVAELSDEGILGNASSFRRTANWMKFGPSVKPGHYLIRDGMNNRGLVTKLRAGDQDPVRLSFNKFRTPERLAGHIAVFIEADSAELMALFSDEEALAPFGLNPDRLFTTCIPNTYEFWWNTSAEGFLERMLREQEAFWSQGTRPERLARQGLSPEQAYIVASIVEEESIKSDERPRIAGVYLNRLRDNWRLEADPTIKFALKQFGLTRVLNWHKEAASTSPYSTYANAGLPPGPICIPSIDAIEAVLNAEEHKYYYMCAKADFSGYHAFAHSLREHNRNAALYRRELNRRNY